MADNNDPPFKRKLLAVLVSSLFVALVLPRAPPEASSRKWPSPHGAMTGASSATFRSHP